MRFAIAIASCQTLVDARFVDLDAEQRAAIHRRRQRLGTAHPAETRREHEAAT